MNVWDEREELFDLGDDSGEDEDDPLHGLSAPAPETPKVAVTHPSPVSE